MTWEVQEQVPGEPDHAAKSVGVWGNLPFRTIVQGLLIELVQAVALVIYEFFEPGKAVDWQVLLMTLLNTVMFTVASYTMAKVKPPTVKIERK